MSTIYIDNPDVSDPDWMKRPASPVLVPGVEVFHLRGQHDQESHGNRGGLPTLMAGWESSKPWYLTKEDAVAQRVPGFWHQTRRGSETASWDGRYIRTTDDFYALPEETRRAVVYHEAGHAALEAAGGVRDEHMGFVDTVAGRAIGYNAEEILAEAYSALWSDPDWFDRMNADEIRRAAIEMAERAGFPLP